MAKRTSELEEQATRDPLTGLANRRALFEALRREISHAVRHGEPLTLAYLDLDGFKAVNDTFGHQEGDRVLLDLAEALKVALREEDMPARVGGDEFFVVLPNADLARAREVVTRLFKAFGARRRVEGVTISMGLAALDLASPQAPETLVRQADEAMYEAKQKRGDAVVSTEGK